MNKPRIKVIIDDVYDYIVGEVTVGFDEQTKKYSYLIRLPESYERLLEPKC